MKRLYIDELVHEQLKKEAKREGRTLQWWVEYKLTSEGLGTKTIGFSEEVTPLYSPDVQGKLTTYIKNKDIRPKNNSVPQADFKEVRAKSDIQRDINKLEREIEAADVMNQDPDYWDTINEKKAKVQELWKEWHSL